MIPMFDPEVVSSFDKSSVAPTVVKKMYATTPSIETFGE